MIFILYIFTTVRVWKHVFFFVFFNLLCICFYSEDSGAYVLPYALLALADWGKRYNNSKPQNLILIQLKRDFIVWGFFSFYFLFPSQLIRPCQTSLSPLCHFCKKRLHTELPCLSQARLRIDTNYCPLPISLVITALARQCNSLIILNNTNQSCRGVRRGNFPKNSCEKVS